MSCCLYLKFGYRFFIWNKKGERNSKVSKMFMYIRMNMREVICLSWLFRKVVEINLRLLYFGF